MKAILYIILLWLVYTSLMGEVSAQSKYTNNNWIVGLNTNIHFSDTGVVVLRTNDTIIDASAAISDSNGQPLFHLNWPPQKFAGLPGQQEIRDKFGNLLPYKSPDGRLQNNYLLETCFLSTRSNLFLESGDKIYYFSTNTSSPPSSCGSENLNIFYSVIDPYLRSDSGAFIQLNLRLSWFHSISAINAVRHADGKSWWIITHLQRSDSFATFLLKDKAFGGPVYSKVSPDVGDLYPNYPRQQEALEISTLTASKDGNKLLFVAPVGGMKVCHVYDFDRCTGEVRNPRDLTILFQDYVADSSFNLITFWGGAFSPSAKYVYLASANRVFKIDLLTSLTRTLLWRSGLLPQVPDMNGPGLCNLGPDGNIYFSKRYPEINSYPVDFCDNINEYINVIRDPDNSDTTGQFQYKGLKIGPGGCLGFGLPVDVNHSLGRSTSECIGYPPVYTAVESPLMNKKTYQIYPNPATTTITLKANAGSLNGQLNFYNLSGQVVYQTSLSNESTHEWNVSGLPSGIYYLRLTDGTSEPFVQKVVVSR